MVRALVKAKTFLLSGTKNMSEPVVTIAPNVNHHLDHKRCLLMGPVFLDISAPEDHRKGLIIRGAPRPSFNSISAAPSVPLLLLIASAC